MSLTGVLTFDLLQTSQEDELVTAVDVHILG
jgi:hypothetical protein